MSNRNNSFLDNKLLTRGSKTGYCRICQQFGNLTRDHIPPKGSIKISSVEIRTLEQDTNIKPVISQNGTNFRTICSYCNNTLLGTEYDPELNKVSNKVGDLIKQLSDLSDRGIFLPPQVTIEVKPQKLARAVIGHLLASNHHPDQSNLTYPGLFPEALQKYFLDKNATLPEEINIYYWFYPSNRQVLVHGAAMCFPKATKQPLFFSLMKFFPIAYWITYKKPQHTIIEHPTVIRDRNIGLDDIEVIKIKLLDYPPLDFPEYPNDDDRFQYILLFNDQLTSVATRKKEKKNKGFGQ